MSDLREAMDRSGPVEFSRRNDAMVREQAIANARKKRIADDADRCSRMEGENAWDNCADLAWAYIDILRDRYNGALFPPGQEPLQREKTFIQYPHRPKKD